ncbi:carboxymethylenebutenolidase [Aphanothece hegewaldii CCALA 016]|uniref:Carboxymethylenebutenolidase n=1 Tax=Aphanothece hegewaldii CCALA 016 TaxID=2107694 RepID=A0A2T1M2U5_9CHRO|nr:dienelactone hydrolase family protein [Aphanothece hegewaldii]PSF39074.1 carboxymethylenebutenolidase [Aphanothece hegewaldii CCALA 016]
MRKYLGLALMGFLVILLSTGLFSPTVAQETARQLWSAHQSDRPIPTPIIAHNPEVPVTGKAVTYGTINGKPITGYLATPSQKTTALPAIIVIHEWWGLNDNIKKMTQNLAGQGYTALAVDVYGGKVADNPDMAMKLVTEALKSPEIIKDNLSQAYTYLQQEQKAPKIASIGWCFGGRLSLDTALLFPKDLDAAVIYYGANMETSPDKLKTLQMPILGIFAQLDKNPPVTTVKQFDTTLKTLGKPAEIYIYPNVNHAFANPSGMNYNAEAAEDAWHKTTVFLEKHLKN